MAVKPVRKSKQRSVQEKSPAKEESLQERLQVGEKLISDIYPKLHDYVSGKLAPQYVDDVLGRILEAVAKNFAAGKIPTADEFVGWCFRIAFNKVMDALRSKYAEKADLMDPEVIAETVAAGSGGEVSPGTRLDIEFFMDLLRRSKFPCDEMLQFHVLKGLTINEIAAMYEFNYDQARMKINRCLEAAEKLAQQFA